MLSENQPPPDFRPPTQSHPTQSYLMQSHVPQSNSQSNFHPAIPQQPASLDSITQLLQEMKAENSVNTRSIVELRNSTSLNTQAIVKLESQKGQIANQVAKRGKGKFPSQPVPNPKG